MNNEHFKKIKRVQAPIMSEEEKSFILGLWYFKSSQNHK